MAGKPRFFRAKRVKYYHTSHTSTFNGSETQHVKTNLTASVDGTHHIKADDLDLNHTRVINAENILRSVKRTVPYTEFTATSRKFPQSVKLYMASPGDTVTNVVANITAAFTAASLMGTGSNAVSRAHFSVGGLGATGGFKTTIHTATDTGWKWVLGGPSTGASYGTYLKSVHASLLTKTYLTATGIFANFRASEDMLASLAAGSIDFYIDVMSRS